MTKEEVIKELEQHGIHYQKDTKWVFKCDKHPYQEETIPSLQRQELFNKLGNLFAYNADTKKLTIKQTKLNTH